MSFIHKTQLFLVHLKKTAVANRITTSVTNQKKQWIDW